MLGGALDGSSDWGLVTAWLPYHFVAAFFAWGLREFFYWLSPRGTATPSASGTPTDPAETENLSESEDTEADTPTTTTAVTEVDNR